MEFVIPIIISLIAITVSIFAIWNENRIALYKMRYEVYNDLRKAIFLFLTHKQEEMYSGFEQMAQLRDKVFFLFGKDINAYYLEIIRNAEVTFNSLDNPKSQEFKDSTMWLVHQTSMKCLMDKFKKYLKLKVILF